jgi:hypothetical protein
VEFLSESFFCFAGYNIIACLRVVLIRHTKAQAAQLSFDCFAFILMSAEQPRETGKFD